MPANNRVVVSCTHGEEDPDRVTVSYLTAGAALDAGKDVVMWLSADGVQLGLQGVADRIRADAEPTVAKIHAQFIEKAAASTRARSASRTASSTRATWSPTQSSREPRR